MFHPAIKTAMGAALSIMLVRLLLYVAGVQWVYLDNALLLVIFAALIPITIYGIWPRTKELSLVDDLKNALQLAIPYSVLVVVLLFVYYQFIDREYFSFMQEGILQRSINENTAQNVDELRAQVSNFFSLRNFSLIVLLILLVLSFFYAFLFAALKRLFLRRF